MDQEEDLLDSLLAVATEELEKLGDCENSKEHPLEAHTTSPKNNLSATSNLEGQTTQNLSKETDIFHKPNSIIHSGDTDSSDDEGNRNYEDQKYNQYGRDIKSLINSSHNSALEANYISSNHYGITKKRISTWKNNPNDSASSTSHGISVSPTINPKSMFGKLPEAERKFQDVFMDPIFGMRIINPLISSTLLMEKMQGRLAVRYSDLSRHLFAGNLKKDWVICAVIVSKTPPKTSSKGSQYSVWTLSDLKGDIKTFSLFLFGGAHKDLWKTVVGTVIGLLNPTIMDQKDGSKNEVSLSVINAQKIMIFGQSKDFGMCKSMKKNGEKCTAVVNLSRCEYCIYHIKQEYQKCSKRSELQANFAGRGLVNLRNKVLGKNEVFYAGKSYMAIPAKKSRKLEVRDQNILQNLNGMGVKTTVKAKNLPKNKKGVARHLDVNPAQRARDLQLLEKLGGSTNLETKTNFSGKRSEEVSLEDSKATALSVINKLKAKKSDSEEHVNKKSQYNIKSDLFVNVENKSTFSGNISEEISLEESKNRALEVISRLKAKSKKIDKSESKDTKRDDEDSLLIEEIEGELNLEDFNYSDDENISVPFSSPVSFQCASNANKVIRTSNDSKNSISNESIIKESAKSILNSQDLDKESCSPKSSPKDKIVIEKTQGIIQTPKSGKNNIESFGKISPKLSGTEFNPNNFGEPRTINTPKSTPKEDSKNLNKYPTPQSFKPKNLKQTFPDDLQTSINGSSQSSLALDATPLGSITECINPNKSCLDKFQHGSKEGKLDSNNMVMAIPMLSGGCKGDLIDLSKPIRSKHVDRAKINAIKFIQRNGPIKKVDPNNTKGSGGKKRNIESVVGFSNDSNNVNTNSVNDQSAAKKSKLQESEFISDRFKKMMAMTSKYAGLLEQHDDEEKEKYFKKLEVKEQMEEKMTNTHKVKCKAVRCLQCKYTSFSASELCKNERHPLKVFDAMKRFYKCSNCQNRTVTLELIPTRPCNNCGSSKWEKTGMMKEKIAVLQHNLSIRGGEQKFVNSIVADANLDLLVPDD